MIKKIVLTLLLLAGIAAGVAAATQRQSTADDKLSVATTFYPLYDFAQQVGGDKVSVKNLTPAGTEPHDYEPSPQSLVTAERSKVFVYNGGNFEPWTEKFLQNYDHTVVKSSSSISLRDGGDPHFWLDPVLAQKVVNNIRDGLSKADPANENYYASRAKSYNAKLAKLHDAYRTSLASCQQHTVISSHEAFSYVAARYDFNVEPIAGISPEEEPSIARLSELSALVKTQNLKYVFFESLVSPRLADTIAQETGAKTLVFDPIEGLSAADQKQGKNYISIQYENLDNLRKALACS
jgi:zinc transport system substrate-binding protein